ncbi:MAG: hypothetical protein ACYC6W_08990 [Nitrosotalea sp.]
MIAKRKIPIYFVIVISFGFTAYFFASPFLSSSNPGGLIPSISQSPDSVSTLASDVDACISSPTSDCDQEMLQIKKYCADNRDQNIPVCSDARVREYVDNRGLERPIINTGG